MKSFLLKFFAPAYFFLIFSSQVHAQFTSITKNIVGTDLTATGSWVDLSTPTATQIASWVDSSLGAGLTLDSNTSWGGIELFTAGAAATADDINITGTGTLTTGNITFDDGVQRTLTLNNSSIALSQNATYHVVDATGDSAADMTVSAGISGAFDLTKTGAGTLLLNSTAKSYTGKTTVSGGELILSSFLGTTSSIDIVGATSKMTVTNFINAISATHGTAVPPSRIITVDQGNITFENSNNETRIGNVTLKNGGTFTTNNTNGFGILLADTTTGAATFKVENSGGNTAAATLNGTGILRIRGIQNFDVADVTGSTAADLNVTAVLANIDAETGGINKTGSGTMNLLAANTYPTSTTVTAGTLLANNTTGSATGAGTVTVATSATLGGGGTISGATTVNAGGSISPGNGAGSLTLDGTYTQNGVYRTEVALGGVGSLGNGTTTVAGTTGTDHLVVNSTVTLGTTGTLEVSAYGGNAANIFKPGDTLAANNAFWLIVNDLNDAISGTFANTTRATQLDPLFAGGTAFTMYSGGQQFAVFYDANFTTGSLTGGNDLLLVAIPEPTRASLFLLSTLLLISRRRR